MLSGETKLDLSHPLDMEHILFGTAFTASYDLGFLLFLRLAWIIGAIYCSQAFPPFGFTF